MEDRSRDESYDNQIAQLIRRKAAKLAHSYPCRYEEQRDIEQDLFLWWREIRTRFDASRGSIMTYADVALNNHIRNLITSRRAQRRAGRTDAKLDPGSCVRLVYPESRDRRDEDDIDQIGREPDYDALALSIDLGRALRQLSLRQREMLETLVQGGVSEVARTLKVSRPTVYQRLRELRDLLIEVGLDEYLR